MRFSALDWRRVDRQAAVIRLDVNETKNDDGREFHYGALTDVCAMMEAQWAAHETLRKAGDDLALRVSAVRREADRQFPQGVDRGVRSGGRPGPDPARLPADGGPQPRAGRRLA